MSVTIELIEKLEQLGGRVLMSRPRCVRTALLEWWDAPWNARWGLLSHHWLVDRTTGTDTGNSGTGWRMRQRGVKIFAAMLIMVVWSSWRVAEYQVQLTTLCPHQHGLTCFSNVDIPLQPKNMCWTSFKSTFQWSTETPNTRLFLSRHRFGCDRWRGLLC